MVTITTKKIEDQRWTIEVSDMDHVNWTAEVDAVEIRLYLETSSHLVANAKIDGEKQSDKIGFAMALLTNWIEAGDNGSEKLLENWHVIDEQMHVYHLT